MIKQVGMPRGGIFVKMSLEEDAVVFDRKDDPSVDAADWVHRKNSHSRTWVDGILPRMPDFH